MAGMMDLYLGQSYLVVGVEDQPDGSTRVYIGARWQGFYFIPDPADAENIKRDWADPTRHLFVSKRDVPEDAIFCEGNGRTPVPVHPFNEAL